MINRIQQTLIQQCDALITLQNNDKASDFFGGFYCSACGIYHGRADNAVFPLVWAARLTGDAKYLAAAEKTLAFRKKLTDTDGGVFNDFGSAWKGITAFSALGFYKALVCGSDILPAPFKNELKRLFAASAAWVHDHLCIGAKAYINYYAASAAVNAAAGKYFGKPEYTQSAKELLNYCFGLFTENGLLCGEGQPHGGKTAKGCRPIDVGYNAEESLPALVDAARLLGDKKAEEHLAGYAVKMLDFMLPDGAWDNSFGLRNNKWTYWGSRTSDGCAGAFYELQSYAPELKNAAVKNTRLLLSLTESGLLQGGRDYAALGQPVCIHHTITHAVSLTHAALLGLTGEEIPEPEPRTYGFSVRYYPELDTYKIKAGKWLATVTAYDYTTGNYVKGASHATGGTLSLLYHTDSGAMIAGSTYDYQRTEPNNMQLPGGNIPHETLLPRAEYEKNGIKYATCLDLDARLTTSVSGKTITVCAEARFCGIGHSTENDKLTALFRYVFTEDAVNVSCRVTGQQEEDIKLIVPIIENSAKLFSDTPFTERKIFFLTGGFAATEYTFCLSAEENRIDFLIGEKRRGE